MSLSAKSAGSHADAELTDEVAQRILDAASALFLEFGFRRTTMEDVARRIGVSRMTIYRYHTDKTALFQAVLLRELQQASFQIEERLAALSIEENPVVEGFALAVRLARQNPLLRRLLSTEPEWTVLHMTVKGEMLLQFSIAAAAAFLRQERFEDWLEERDLDLASELMVRMLQSALLTPGGVLTSDDEEELRRVAAYLLQPLLRRPPR